MLGRFGVYAPWGNPAAGVICSPSSFRIHEYDLAIPTSHVGDFVPLLDAFHFLLLPIPVHHTFEHSRLARVDRLRATRMASLLRPCAWLFYRYYSAAINRQGFSVT